MFYGTAYDKAKCEWGVRVWRSL